MDRNKKFQVWRIGKKNPKTPMGTDGYEFVDGDDVLGTFVCRVSELEGIAHQAKNYRKRLNLAVAILIVATLVNIFQMSVIYKLSKVQTSVEIMND